MFFDQRVLDIVNYSLKNVSFYQNYNLKEVESYEEFIKIPFLNKESISNEWENLISKDFNKEDLIIDFTSGSTGKPLKVTRSLLELNDARKMLWKYRCEKLPNCLNLKRAEFGRNVRYFLKNPEKTHLISRNALYLKSTLSLEYTKKQLEILNDYQPEWLVGSPSYMAQFANHIKKIGGINFTTKVIETTGEHLTVSHRKILEEVFRCPIINNYGTREVWPIAYEEDNNLLKINNRDVFIEIIDSYGHPVKEGEVGEIVITALRIKSLPLIRYKLGDIGFIFSETNNKGETSKYISLSSSRLTDYAVTRDGNHIGAFVFSSIFVDRIFRQGFEGINAWQVIQKDYEVFEVIIVLDKNNIDKAKLMSIISYYIKQITSPNVEVLFSFKNEIPVKESGKLKYFISEVVSKEKKDWVKI